MTAAPQPGFRRNLPQLLAVFAVAFVVYAVSASHTVGLEDDGMFILAMWNGGIAHPPGYPLYTLLGKLVTSLPGGTVAYKAHLTSALFGAGAAAALWWCIRLLVPGALPAWAGALAFAFSRTFWSQAVVAEVYTLNALFFFSLLAMALHLHCQTGLGDRQRNRLLAVMALLAGLSLTNHWPLMVLASPALIILLLPEWRRLLRLSPLLGLAFVIGLAPYLWMVWRSQQPDAISFYGPIDSFEEFLFVFLRKGYSAIDESGTDDLWDKLYFSGFFLRQLTVQMGIAGFLLAAAGLILQPRAFGLRVTLSLLAGFACSSLVLIALLGFDHSTLYEAVFRVYPLVAYGVMAIWVALGLHQVLGWINSRVSAATAPLIRWSMVLLLLGPVLFSGWHYNDRRNLTYPADYGHTVLESLPLRAVLFAGDDVGFGATAYLNLIEGVRPDVTVREPLGLVLPNRLLDPLASDADGYALALGHFVSDSDRPVYLFGKQSPFSGTEHLGFYSRFQPDLDAATRFTIDPALFSAWEALLTAKQGEDEWLQIHRNSVSRQFGFVLGAAPSESAEFMQARLTDYPALSNGNLAGLIGIAQGLMDSPNRAHQGVILDVLTRIEQSLDEQTAINDRASYYSLSGSYFVLSGDLATAEIFLKRSLELWPATANPAYAQLAAIYEAMERTSDLDVLDKLLNRP